MVRGIVLRQCTDGCRQHSAVTSLFLISGFEAIQPFGALNDGDQRDLMPFSLRQSRRAE